MKTQAETHCKKSGKAFIRLLSKTGAISLLATIFLSFLQVAAAEADTSNWTVENRVVVETEDVSLADLVDKAPEEWEEVALGKAPGPGRERTLRRAWVLSRARIVDAQNSLSLPEEVVLARPGRQLTSHEVKRAVQDALNTRLDSTEGMHVDSVGLPGFVPLGKLNFDVHLPDGPLPSRSTIYVDVFSKDKKVGMAWAKVDTFESSRVVVLTTNLKKGDEILPDHLELAEGKVSGDALDDLSQAVGMRLVRSLRAGTALKRRDVETAPSVERGEAVKLVARVGAITASTMGKALEAGSIGQTIRVANMDSGEILSGVLGAGKIVNVSAAH